MKRSAKIGLALGTLVLAGAGISIGIYEVNKGVPKVQTGRVVREDLVSEVSASGEIRPENYTNVLGEGFGKITKIVVKEGQRVKKGDVLLKLESVQPAADVQAQQANIEASEAGINVAEANYKAAQATLAQKQADLEKTKFDWGRSQQLYAEQLIAKQDYDAAKAAYDGSTAGVQASQAQLQQMKASLDVARSNLQQAQAVLAHQQDVLRKTTYTAPIDGTVTYIAVRVGENVVPGIQNATGSFLMTISDMSVVTAEVRVDETDIVSVKSGQTAQVSIDAIPEKTFAGHVIDVGDQAILRSSGLATTQTEANTDEARDFKVVVRLDNPPANLRPGLSVTAKIKTAGRKDVLTVPIQALAVRSQADIDAQNHPEENEKDVTLAAPQRDAAASTKTDVQGVFVIRDNKAEFVPVQTGISGVTDVEITNGLQQGDAIVTGSYKALRTLRPGAKVKVDNSAPAADSQPES